MTKMPVVVALACALLGSACGPFIRHNVATYSATGPELTSLRNGVAAMQARAPSDPTSWSYQAAMHGSTTTPALANWNACQHGSYFFFAWHRMYLYYFERILRKASGDNGLTLPYWNYTIAAQASLPAPFRSPATGNSLYVSQRNSSINSGGTLPASATDPSGALAYTNFDSAAGSPASFGGPVASGAVHFSGPHGALESQPHDIVHVLVGGWMGDPNTAAQDPIFYLHHANIDRLWNKWIQDGGGRADPSDATWLNTAFTFFDETGAAVTLTGAQVVDTVKQLNYCYDDDPGCGGVTVKKPPVEVAGPVKPKPGDPVELGVSEAGARVSLTEADAEVKVTLRPDAQAAVKTAGHVLLRIEGIEFDKVPGEYYEIYLNAPSAELRTAGSPAFAANLAFFGLKHSGHPGGDSLPVVQAFDITKTVKALQEKGLWNGQSLTVHFVRRGVIPPPGEKEQVGSGVRATFARVIIAVE